MNPIVWWVVGAGVVLSLPALWIYWLNPVSLDWCSFEQDDGRKDRDRDKDKE